jgi:predicted nucleic acid-binding protein
MKIADALRGMTRLFLDTAPVIYFVERNPNYAALVDEIFDRIDAGTITAATSPITLAECLVVPMRKKLVAAEQDFTDLIVSGANVTFMGIDSTIARQAAQFRAHHNLKLADAFQGAVAFAAGCNALLTNDLDLKRIRGINVLVLDELEL